MSYASTGGQDIRWDPRRVEMGRNFGTKLWNAARFALSHLTPDDARTPRQPQRLADRWILARLAQAEADVTRAFEAFDLGAATRAAYDFTWSEFCDWYIEAAKPALRAGDATTRATLRHVLEGVLKLLHPVMPFVTSEIWEAVGSTLGVTREQLAWAPWPQATEAGDNEQAALRDFGRLQAAVGAVRALRVDADLPPGQVIPVLLQGDGAAALRAEAEVFSALARVRLEPDGATQGAALAQPVADVVLQLPLEGVIDVGAWTQKQKAKLAAQEAEAQRSRGKLGNERFVQGAPAEVVAEERRRLEEAERLIAAIRASLAQVGQNG